MAGKSDYLENKILNFLFNGTAYTLPSFYYLALFTSAPTDAGGGTEVSGGGYARLTLPPSISYFTTATAGVTKNKVPFAFSVATVSWGVVTSWGIYDASSGGNLIMWGNLSSSLTISVGRQLIFPIDSLVITED
ncbi:MAG: hypothetical protein WC100_03335 [Sterolibacterium sp.]